jgi:photosynthetic reaction center cytochrome c subunit
MTKQFVFALATASLIHAQTPDFAGVWKADLQKSKIPGPPVKDFLDVIQQKAANVTETMVSVGEHGAQKSVLFFATDGKPTIKLHQGVPTRTTASLQDGALTVKGEISGRPEVFERRYELSPDGQTLTITFSASMHGHQMQSTYVLLKQPDSAGTDLLKPEPPASERFKNVKTPLKTLPSSQFIDQMRYFAWALNKDCEFCHVKNHFDSDDKKEKRTARKMIEMVAAIDKDNFDNKAEVRCYTCHSFHSHPQNRPLFEGEPEHNEHEGHEHEHDAERNDRP